MTRLRPVPYLPTSSDVATRGGEVVGQVVQIMSGINESRNKIVDIIGLIEKHRIPAQHSVAERGRGSRARRRTELWPCSSGQRSTQPDAACGECSQGEQSIDRLVGRPRDGRLVVG